MDDLEKKKWAEFGQYVRKIRKSKNLSMYQIEQEHDFSRQYFSRIELNRHGYAIKPELIQKIAKILDMNYLELYNIVGYSNDDVIADYYKKHLLNKEK